MDDTSTDDQFFACTVLFILFFPLVFILGVGVFGHAKDAVKGLVAPRLVIIDYVSERLPGGKKN